MTKAATWADGVGRWHAVVADTPRGLANAVEAISQEILARSPRNTPMAEVRGYVHQNIVTWDQEGTEPGFIHFAEYGPED